MKQPAKQASKPAAPAPTVRPGTREYRDVQRAEFNKRFESAKKGRK